MREFQQAPLKVCEMGQVKHYYLSGIDSNPVKDLMGQVQVGNTVKPVLSDHPFR